MGTKYIDLILCMDDEKNYILCKAPTGTYLEAGDKVVIDLEDKPLYAEVLDRWAYVQEDDEPLRFVLTMLKTTFEDIPKILCKVHYNYFEYEKEA